MRRYALQLLCMMLIGGVMFSPNGAPGSPSSVLSPALQSPALQASKSLEAEYDNLLGLAKTYRQKGFRSKALPLLLRAEELSEKLSTKKQIESRLLLGRLFFELGEYPLSLQQLEHIPAITSDPYYLAEALNTIATTQSTLNSPKDATVAFNKAYELSLKSKDRSLQLTILTNQLRHSLDHGNRHEISPLLILSWSLADETGRQPQADVNISLANLYRRAFHEADLQKFWLRRAMILLDQAGEIARLTNNTLILSYALGYQAQLYVDNGNLTDGLAFARTASFLANSIGANESAYLWEWQIARIHHAQSETQKAIASYERAIDTLEHVRQDLINGSPFTFHQKVRPLFTQLSDILLHTASNVSSEHKQSYLKQVQGILEQSKSAELQDYFQNDCVIPDKSIDLGQIEQATAVIYPVILPDRLEILLNINDQIYQTVSHISEQELDSLVNEFRDHLQLDQGDDEYLELGQELYALLFADIEDLLAEKDIDTLLIIPDGVLRTVPMAAVYDGEQFMVQKYAIATTPGITLTLPKPLDVQKATLFAGGISDAVQGFPGLSGVPSELENLRVNYGATILKNTAFQTDAISQQLKSSDYSIVHIATHGHFDRNPQKSFLLTYNGVLTLDMLEQSIGGRRYLGNPLELLVLSACESAAGDSRAALGLAGVALKAGARSALATLWQISDAATVKIIASFYENAAKPDVTKAEALRVAQIALINEPQFQHPTDWAPFLLIGNWL